MLKHLLLRYASLLFIIVLSVFFQFLLTHTHILLQYQREEFFETFFTQCVTPSLVHINWTHWLFNILNLLALVILFPRILEGKRLFLLFLFSSVGIMLCLYYLSSYVLYYAGMSGVLYSLAVYASLFALREKRALFVSIGVLTYVIVKLLAHDWINEIMGVSQALQDMPIVTEVHWYGAVLGVVSFFLSTKRLGLFKSS